MKKQIIMLLGIWLLTFVPAMLYAQSENFQVSGLSAGEVWPIVKMALKDKGISVEKLNSDAGNLTSSYFEYTQTLTRNRAKFFFDYQNGLLTVSLTGKQYMATTGWADATIKGNQAEKKQIPPVIDRINAIKADPAIMKTLAEPSKQSIPAPASATGNNPINSVNAGAAGQTVKRPSIANAKTVIADYFGEFRDGLCAIKKGDKWGFMDTLGNIVIDINLPFSTIFYDYPYFTNGLCMLPKGKTGNIVFATYIDKKGNEVIKNPAFLQASPFCDGYATVSTNTNKYIYINTKGVQVFAGTLTQTVTGNNKPPRPFSDGLSCDVKKYTYGFFNQNGSIVIPADYGEVEDFSEGLATVQKTTTTGERKWGFIDKTGKVVIDFLFTNKPGNFSDGMVKVTDAKGGVGYMDKKGNLVIDTKFVGGYSFCQGIAFVHLLMKPFPVAINKSGEILSEVPVKNFQLKAPINNGFGVYSEGSDYSYGTIDPTGKIILHAFIDKEGIIYKYIGPFSNGLSKALAPVDKKMMEGFINTSGDFVILRGESKF